ncbi:hypothetical protein J6590_064986 [Homalodisca vitripennis]|nr:hypothetical protein J6590_064986 [Homalodisca vitripennis]
MKPFVVLVIVVIMQGVSGSCPEACLDVFDPVCGCSPSGVKTFPNSCYLELANCQGEDYSILHTKCCNENDKKICDCKNTVCLAVIDFVCAYSCTKGCRTFSNTCQLGIENDCYGGDYVYRYKGECVTEGCRDDETCGKCSRACSRSYLPVCGCSTNFGFRTFNNECLLNRENQCNDTDYSITAYEPCIRDTDDASEVVNGCDNCPPICITIYDPVCGESATLNTQTIFSNQCFLGGENRCRNGDYTECS